MTIGFPKVRYWIFQAEPNDSQLTQLQPGKEAEWPLTDYTDKVKNGDIVYFWQAGSEEAILGWGSVGLKVLPDPAGSDQRVPVDCTFRFDKPLTLTALRNDRRLRWLSILRSSHGTNFLVTPEQVIALNRMLLRQKQKAPPDPGPYLHFDLLEDINLSETTKRIVEEAQQWTTAGKGSLPAVSSSSLLFAFSRIGLTSRRDFLDTSRFLARQAEKVDQQREAYLRDWSNDPELRPEILRKSDSYPDYPAITLNAALLLSAAERMAIATTGTARVSLRHLLGTILESASLVPEQAPDTFQKYVEDLKEGSWTVLPVMGARQRLEEAGLKIPDFRRDFIVYLRQYHPHEPIGVWEEMLLAPNERITLLSNYNADLPEGEDRLDIGAEIDAMASLVAARQVKPPLSIGLFGDWGSGKSFFMQKMMDRVKWICTNLPPNSDPETLPFYRNIVQIEFNAWHYSESKLWASLVTHIFDNLRLAVEGESEDNVEQRRELILNELEALKKLKEQADEELQATQDKLDTVKQVFNQAKQEAERRKEKLEDVRRRDVFDALVVTPEIQTLYAGAQKALGLEEVTDNAQTVYRTVQQIYTVGGRAQALGLSIVNSEGWKRRLLWLGSVLIAFIILSFSVNLIWPESLSEMWQEIRTFVVALVSLLGVGAGWLKTHLDSADRALKLLGRANEAFSKQMERERERIDSELDIRRKEFEEQLKTVDDARRKVHQAERELEEKQAELRDLEPARRFARFIEERALSDDYRKELGILALIRKDFEKLVKFLSSPDSRKRSELLAIDRVILYIDDLDRCPEDQVIKVLQAIHLLLAFELFIVVVAVDARWIRKSLVKQYDTLIKDARPHLMGSEEHVTSDTATSEDYLEKIFQIPFWIKPMGETGARALVQDLLRQDLESIPTEEREPLKLLPPSPEGSELQPEDGGSHNVEEDRQEVRVEETEAEITFDADWILEPQRLTINHDEFDVIEQLVPLIGRSPRAVKRFVNVYRLLRAGLHREELSKFLGENKETPHYPAALLLLALLNGSPTLATEIFKRLGAGNMDEMFDAFISQLEQDTEIKEKSEWRRFFSILAPFRKAWGRQLKVGLFQQWTPRVARYSFRMEMAVVQ